MGCRALLLIFVLGGALCLYGWREYRLARSASHAPEAITIEELERGVPANPHRTIGEHIPVDALVVYSYGKKSGKISHAFYPIISTGSLLAAREKALKKVGSTSRVKEDDVHEAIEIRVLVKTNQWSTPADLRTAMSTGRFPTRDLTGMVINDVSSLGSSEKAMLREKFKSFDESPVVIFEVGRTPTSMGLALAALGGGAALFLLGIVLALGEQPRRSRR